MDKDTIQKLLNMMSSGNDTDAIMGLRGLQGYLQEEGVEFKAALQMMVDHLHTIKKAPVVEAEVITAQEAPKPVALGGMPECTSRQGVLYIGVPGRAQLEQVELPGASAAEGQMIAENLKDAMVAAVINRSKMKLKLLDVKNGKGEIVETALQAEYDREGMMPIRVWVNVRGEVASLAAVLRKAIANAAPELVAA